MKILLNSEGALSHLYNDLEGVTYLQQGFLAAHKEMQEYWTIICDSFASSFGYLFSHFPRHHPEPRSFFLPLLPPSFFSLSPSHPSFPFFPSQEKGCIFIGMETMQVRAMYRDPNMLVIFQYIFKGKWQVVLTRRKCELKIGARSQGHQRCKLGEIKY